MTDIPLNHDCVLDPDLKIDSGAFFEKDIISKPVDDDTYDLNFLTALDNRFYNPEKLYSWIEPFHVFDWETRALYKYYEYSLRHLTRILNEERLEIEAMLNASGCSGEDQLVYGEMLSIDSDYLLDINAEATLLMLYTLFENLLSSLVKYAMTEESMPRFIEGSYGQAKVNQYIDYLQVDCLYDFEISHQQKDQLKLMRIIRNYFVHDSKGTVTIDFNSYRNIKHKPEYKDGELHLNRKYIVSCFELTSEIATELEKAMAK